jgi:hypothetical protein
LTRKTCDEMNSIGNSFNLDSQATIFHSNII